MTDDELEGQLRAHYRTIDPMRAPGDLGRRVEDAMDRRVRRPVFIVRSRPAFAAALAAVLIVAVGLGLRPGGFLSPGVSPSPTTSPTSSPTSLSASASPTAGVPSGSLAPASTKSWTGLNLVTLAGAPARVSVTTWSGGYVALGAPTNQVSLPGWISRDGRTWTELPADTFGAAAISVAAPCADGVVVAVQSQTGERTVWRSADGVTWTSVQSPQMRISRDGDLAGNQTGAVAIPNEPTNGIVFSSDGATWQTVSLPGASASRVEAVAAFRTGFVALGDSGSTTRSPLAWSSTDGLHWTRATVENHPDYGFFSVASAGSGLVAFSTTAEVPGLTAFWTSSDGRHWKVSVADPFGVIQEGEGVGSANGNFTGDGTRLLGSGRRAAGQPTDYWTSLDGTRWTKLALTGDTAAVVAEDVTPFLMPDGVFFSGDSGAWFGAALP
jgi:hypothetical protein